MNIPCILCDVFIIILYYFCTQSYSYYFYMVKNLKAFIYVYYNNGINLLFKICISYFNKTAYIVSLGNSILKTA